MNSVYTSLKKKRLKECKRYTESLKSSCVTEENFLKKIIDERRALTERRENNVLDSG